MNFKRKLVSAAVLSAFGLAATTASAVNLSETGSGQVFFFPYYTTQDSNGGNYDTYVHLLNSTSLPKAVKIRFREGRASKEVLDFNIYLSAYDMWTGAVTVDTTTGGAKIVTSDKTCTVPAVPAAGEPFRNYLYTQTTLGDNRDGGPQTLDRTREGYLEVIEMGVPNAAYDLKDGTNFVDAITHDQTVMPVPTPPGCPSVVASWKRSNSTTTNSWFDTVSGSLDAPIGGLIAAGEIINVAAGDSFGMEPTAIANWSLGANHAYPGTESPSIATGDTVSQIFTNIPATPVAASDWVDGVDSVSALLMRSAVINEFTVNPTVNSMTDWVVTFPTKHFYVPTDGSPAGRPFNTAWDTTNGKSCEPVGVDYWNREESHYQPPTESGVDFSPQLPEDTPGLPVLCYESNVITFIPSDADATTYKGMLNSAYQRGLQLNNTADSAKTYFKTGWMRLNLTVLDGANRVPMIDNAGNTTYSGLPVIGFAAVGKYAPGGAVGNYGTEKLHKYQRTITGTISATLP